MQSTDVPTNKTEAIRRAVEVLGYHASVDQILDYVRAHFENVPTGEGGRPTAEAPEANARTPRRGKK